MKPLPAAIGPMESHMHVNQKPFFPIAAPLPPATKARSTAAESPEFMHDLVRIAEHLGQGGKRGSFGRGARPENPRRRPDEGPPAPDAIETFFDYLIVAP